MIATMDQRAVAQLDAITGHLLDCVDDAIVVIRADMVVTYANRSAAELATPTGGDSVHDVGVLDPARLVHADDLTTAYEAVQTAIQQGRTTARIRLALPNGERPVEITLTSHLDTPGIHGVVACFRNLEHEAALERSLERERQLDHHIRVALTDQLTGLPTRRLLLDRLETAMSAARTSGEAMSVFFIDLDGFKAINDALGHSAGDAMLRSTTNRLLATLDRPKQWGRIGGDEFVVFEPACGRDRAIEIANELSVALRQSIVLGGRSFYTSASIGIAVIEDDNDGVDAEGALRRADIAMFEGKRQGRSGITVFRPEMEHRVVVRAELEHQLRATLTSAGPDVVFQPIVHLGTGLTTAVEALARWHSPTRGPIGPDRFVAMAEGMGVVDQLDHHVLRKATRAMRDATEPTTGLMLDLTVNSSTLTLSNPDAAARILAILANESFPPERLILEVTESIAVEDDSELRQQLAILRKHGVRIAVDDFGTGQSSLAQLELLPVDIVKLDRSFLADVPGSERRLRYVQTIIALANALDLQVICEGVERRDQARMLDKIGVSLAQGYLLAEPTGARDLVERMQRAVAVVHESISATQHIQGLIDWRGL